MNDSDKCQESADKLRKNGGSTGEQCLNTHAERGLVCSVLEHLPGMGEPWIQCHEERGGGGRIVYSGN